MIIAIGVKDGKIYTDSLVIRKHILRCNPGECGYSKMKYDIFGQAYNW